MAWQWRYEWDGTAPADQPLGSSEFPSQAEAEAWLGEAWADLLAQGIPAVTLLEDGRTAYGPMSLSPAE